MQTVVEEREDKAVISTPDEVTEPPQISDLARFLRRTRALVPLAMVGFFLLAFLAFLYFAKMFVMPVVIAVLLMFLLKPVVQALKKMRIPEPIGALLVMVTFFASVSFAFSGLLQPAAQWVSRAPEVATKVEGRLHYWLRRAERLTRAAAQVGDITKGTDGEPAPKVEVQQSGLVNTVFVYTKTFVTGTIETVVLLFFMLAAGNLFTQKLVRILPTLHDKKKAVGILDEVQSSLSAFLFTITLINVLLGGLVGLAAFLIGLPNPVLWGVLAGVLNYIPYFGPITGVVVLTIAGFVTFESPVRAMAPAAIYLCLHAVESNFFTPMILGRRLTLSPLVIFLSLMFWTWLWGIPGALLSVPMLMMLKIFCDHFKPLAPIAEFLSA